MHAGQELEGRWGCQEGRASKEFLGGARSPGTGSQGRCPAHSLEGQK